MSRSTVRLRSMSLSPPRGVGTAACVLVVSPFVLMHAQWLLSWAILGHRPRPSIDDPQSIAGASWMHGITACALIAWPVIAFSSVVNLCWYLGSNREAARRAGWWAAALVVGLAVSVWDPLSVGYWWID